MSIPVVTSQAYDEIIDFFAAGTTPQTLIDFKPSEVARERVADLIFNEKNLGLTGAEKAELDQYLLLEHMLRLAKARAHQYVVA